MPDDRHFWVLDSRVLEYVKFSEFHWWELLLIAAGLSLLLGYALLALFLDRRERARERRGRHRARLEAWLERCALDREELAALAGLAGSARSQALYRLLADPVRFETAVHEAAAAGEHLGFLDRVREVLGYASGNLHVPIVSTRQLVPGDHFRFSVWEEGRPQHHFGVVTAVSPAGVAVELTAAGFRSVQSRGAETDLFYLRGNDVEYRFPLAIRSADGERHRLLLAHQLVRGGQRPRGTRLPMMRAIAFRVRRPVGELEAEIAGVVGEEAAPAPARQGEERRGALLEMSEGGLSLVTQEPVAEGTYLDYEMPLPRGRLLPLVARVLDCRPFAGNRWLVRCELRGLSPTQRNTLSQALRLELQRRLRAMQDERRKRRRAEQRGA